MVGTIKIIRPTDRLQFWRVVVRHNIQYHPRASSLIHYQDRGLHKRVPKTMSPLVSIVIPTFNRKSLLLEAIESCLNQTWSNCEVIVVDDGSSDGTSDLVEKRLRTLWPSSRVQYVRQQNAGASSARNHGFKLASGVYIQFLDSDDLLLPAKLAKQIEVLEQQQNTEAACCYCYGTVGIEPGFISDLSCSQIGSHATDPRALIRELCSRIVHGMQTSAPLWRRSFLKKHAGWREDISLGDDLEFHIRLLANSKKICFIEEELFFVREHSGSRLSADQLSELSLDSIIRTRRSIFEILKKFELWDSQTQRAFLGAMRSIYANALQLGNSETIHNLENWIWILAAHPNRIRKYNMLIVLRLILGRHLLLGAHKLIQKLRPT